MKPASLVLSCGRITFGVGLARWARRNDLRAVRRSVPTCAHRVLGWLGLAVSFLSITSFSLSADLQDGWQALAAYRTERALDYFESAQDDADPAIAREARFGRAIALLDKQPITAAQLDEARREFAALADSGTDDCAQGARFFVGRIAQHHLVEPDVAEASRQFRRLIAEHPDSIWAQTALSRLALLEIYAMNPDLLPADRIAAAEKVLVHARSPTARCELHYVIANAILFYRLPEATALPHLLAAEQTGRLEWNERGDVLVQIAELSRLAGDTAQAAEYYQKFLKENPRDQRHYIVKERLAELKL